ncbi:hypothetical protein KY363_08460 [Candidatus Woesearchaeota archaeon]|nr:hypothetical protein [Candidatus Woesearchaeota archaeon]
MRRTHTCGELNKKHIGKAATLQGWINKSRSHGGVLFIDIRDRYGMTQVVIRPDNKFFKEAEGLKRESVIEVSGKVAAREQVNPNMPTGDIELIVDTLKVHCSADALPVDYDDPSATRQLLLHASTCLRRVSSSLRLRCLSSRLLKEQGIM